MKILFAGGGTGGHLYSGIALAEEFLASGSKDREVLFVGTPAGMEKEIVPKNGYRLELIPVKPLKGRGMADRIKSLAQIPSSFLKARALLRKEKPDLVFGIGGYASGPVTLMAHFMGIPTAIIDQNSVPGMTNRILGKFVDHIFVCFENAKAFFKPAKTFLSGNPVRKSFLDKLKNRNAFAPKPEGEFNLLILGGSQGARSVNQAAVGAAAILKNEFPGLKIQQQAGKNDYESVKKAYAEKGIAAEVFDFVHNIHELYANADLIVCRAGAGTITEIEIMGKAAIYVPYPFAADDHQRFNAQEVIEHGAGKMILNSELSAERLAEEIKALIKNPIALELIRQNVQRLAKPHAAQQILQKCGILQASLSN